MPTIRLTESIKSQSRTAPCMEAHSVARSVAGTFWQVGGLGATRFVQAYFKCDQSGGVCTVTAGARTYHRCNPQGDACDTVYLVNSPVVSGDWPLFGLLNAV